MYRKLLPLLFLVILLSYSLPIQSNAASSPLISVKLSNYLGDRKEITLGVSGEYVVSEDLSLKSGTYTIRLQEGSLILYNGSTLIKNFGTSFTAEPLVYGTNNYVEINSNPYLGTMKFTIDNNYIRPINTLHIEDYLKGVVPKEMSASRPLEALKAQALAARTYVIRYAGGTITDTQSHQVYGGYIWKNEDIYYNSSRAVDETQGEIITYNGSPIEAFYSSTNGGMILSNTNSWGTNNDWYPYLQKKEDPYDLRSGSPYVNWDIILKKNEIDLSNKDLSKPESWWSDAYESNYNIANRIKKWMYDQGKINRDYEFKIVGYSNVSFTKEFTSYDLLSGKITFNYILKNVKTNTFRKDTNGNIAIYSYTIDKRSYTIRSILGTTTMYSPYVKEVVISPDSFIMKGGGYGHGIGMSQYGAYQMAKEGFNYKDIITFYFPGTQFKTDSILVSKVDLVNIEANIPSPQSVGKTVTITATATGGIEKLYRFYLLKDGKWNMVQDYSSNNQFSWTPKSPGTYKFSVHAKDIYSTNAYDDYITLDYEILAEPVDVQSVTADKVSPQPVNSTIKVVANATGGVDKQYKFHLFDGTNWTVVQDYSSQNSFTWNPTKPGNYKFSVHVKDLNSSNLYDDYETLTYQIADPIDAYSLTTDIPSPQLVNTPITLTAKANGGIKPLFKFYVYNGTEWVVLQDYSPSNTLSWTPTTTGDYKFSVHVRDESSKNQYDDYITMNYTITYSKVNFESIETSKASPQPANVPITIVANATGGVEKLYKFYVYDGKQWIVLREYSKSNSIDWIPSKPGNYKFSIHVKDKYSNKSYDDFGTLEYKIKEPVKVTSLSFDQPSPQQSGQFITINAQATGSSHLVYKFIVFDGAEWKVLQNYSSSNTYKWLPEAGTYKVVVHVKDKDSIMSYDSYTYKYFTITEGPVKLVEVEKDLESPQNANTSITMTAKAVGGTNKLYSFHVYDGVTWSTLRQYSSSNIFTWTPNKSGNYKISVHVKDSNSNKKYDDYKAFNYQIK